MIVLVYWLVTLKMLVPTKQTFNVFEPDVFNFFMLIRCITGGPISFKVELVSTQYFDRVRRLVCDPTVSAPG